MKCYYVSIFYKKNDLYCKQLNVIAKNKKAKTSVHRCRIGESRMSNELKQRIHDLEKEIITKLRTFEKETKCLIGVVNFDRDWHTGIIRDVDIIVEVK